MNQSKPMSQEEIDLGSLMDRAKAGDTAAFGLLYEQCFVPVFRYLYLRVRDKEEAEDLAQTVFLKAYQGLKNWQNQGKPPLAYFFRIARNALIDRWRKPTKPTLSLEDLPFDPASQQNSDRPDFAITEEISTKNFLQLLNDLSAEQQEVIILRFIEEKTIEEISTIINKSQVAVRQIQHRGLVSLRQKLAKQNDLTDNK